MTPTHLPSAEELKPIIGCDGCEQYEGLDADQGYLPKSQRLGPSEYTRFLATGGPFGDQHEQVVYCLGCEETARFDGATLTPHPRPLTTLERDEPCSVLPEPFRKLIRDFGDTSFACGEWTKDEDESYEQVHDEHIAAATRLRDALLPLLPKAGGQ